MRLVCDISGSNYHAALDGGVRSVCISSIIGPARVSAVVGRDYEGDDTTAQRSDLVVYGARRLDDFGDRVCLFYFALVLIRRSSFD